MRMKRQTKYTEIICLLLHVNLIMEAWTLDIELRVKINMRLGGRRQLWQVNKNKHTPLAACLTKPTSLTL